MVSFTQLWLSASSYLASLQKESEPYLMQAKNITVEFSNSALETSFVWKEKLVESSKVYSEIALEKSREFGALALEKSEEAVETSKKMVETYYPVAEAYTLYSIAVAKQVSKEMIEKGTKRGKEYYPVAEKKALELLKISQGYMSHLSKISGDKLEEARNSEYGKFVQFQVDQVVQSPTYQRVAAEASWARAALEKEGKALWNSERVQTALREAQIFGNMCYTRLSQAWESPSKSYEDVLVFFMAFLSSLLALRLALSLLRLSLSILVSPLKLCGFCKKRQQGKPVGTEETKAPTSSPKKSFGGRPSLAPKKVEAGKGASKSKKSVQPETDTAVETPPKTSPEPKKQQPKAKSQPKKIASPPTSKKGKGQKNGKVDNDGFITVGHRGK